MGSERLGGLGDIAVWTTTRADRAAVRDIYNLYPAADRSLGGR
jgi:hypothetical protein